ncbi:uncharacterized protein BP5553_09569 [Venustampulla echinocandica]|uniref:Uncharacterized protein n=1 Tax=Venustampulla echinocandica TaxID=2656787 RepID=A0A370TBD8_9HELO|nr:uncharacterized protein BP5553_09569 [Venustampulla echinocandica]RDL31360.1 hypothetical protein BP5553_09569 [Venustampulla echinocandica]
MGYAEERWCSEHSASASQPSLASSQHASAIPEPYYYLGYFPSEDQLSFYLDIQQEGMSALSGGDAMAKHPSDTLWKGGYGPASSGGESDEATQDRTPLYSVPTSTHDTCRAKYHMKELGTFARRVEEAALRAFPNRGRSRYKQVIAVLIQWGDDNSTVQPEIDRMRTILEACYGFYTHLWHIPSTASHLKLMSMALQFVQDYGTSDNLLVVYYGGPSVISNSGQSTWMYGQDPFTPSVNWSAIQSLFEESRSDVLFLLDCCATRGLARGGSHGVIETIAACESEPWVGGPGRNLFTNALISVLEDWVTRPSFTAAMLHSEVLAAMKTEQPARREWTDLQDIRDRKTPIYLLDSIDPKALSIELATRRIVNGRASANFSWPGVVLSPSNPSPVFSKFDIYNPANLLRTLKNGHLQIPHVLISVALEEHQSSDFEAWYRWIRQVPGLANYAVVEGIYKSHSTMLLVSIPLLIWDMLPDDHAVSFVGYVQSRNLLAAESVEDFQRLAGVKETVSRPESQRKSTKAYSTPSPIPTEKQANGMVRGTQSPEPALESATLIKITTLSAEKPSYDPKQVAGTSSESNRRFSKMEDPPQFDSFAIDAPGNHRTLAAKDLDPSRRSAKPDAQVQAEIFGTGKLIKDLMQEAKLAREEASRAWDELGKREKEERDKLSKLREGKSVFVGPFQVSAVDERAAPPDMSSKAAAILGTILSPREAMQQHKRSKSEPRNAKVGNNKAVYSGEHKANIPYGAPPPPNPEPKAIVLNGHPSTFRDPDPGALRTMMSFEPSEETLLKEEMRSARLPNRQDLETAYTFLDDEDMHEVGKGLGNGYGSGADPAVPRRKGSKLVKKPRDFSGERVRRSVDERLGIDYPILRCVT